MIAIGSIKIVVSSVTRGTLSRDSSMVKFDATPYTKIEVCLYFCSNRLIHSVKQMIICSYIPLKLNRSMIPMKRSCFID